MAPFSQWLPPKVDQASDLVLNLVADGPEGLQAAGMVLEETLADEGFDFLAEKGDLGWTNGHPSLSTLRLRVATEPMSSIGDGCDVLAFLATDADELRSCGLVQGSVLIAETRTLAHVPPRAIPAGVITYSVPFTDLSSRYGRESSERGMIAIGVLTELLRMPWQTVRSRGYSDLRRRCFDVGIAYAKDYLAKRDIFALSIPRVARRHVLLDAHQAVLLGLGIATCNSHQSFQLCLDNQQEQWMDERIHTARQLDSSFMVRRLPGRTIYRSLQGKLTIMMGTANPTLVGTDYPGLRPFILVANDLVDTIRLVGAAHRLLTVCDGPVWVVVDQLLTNRQQSVPIESLEAVIQEASDSGLCELPSTDSLPLPEMERDGEQGADIGYVTWGPAQGVVREAVELCRGLGMKVAALYPKVLSPVPIKELESFAASVKHLVVVEPDRARRYTALVKSWTKLEPTTLMPKPGDGLTPLDILLREGLGT